MHLLRRYVPYTVHRKTTKTLRFSGKENGGKIAAKQNTPQETNKRKTCCSSNRRSTRRRRSICASWIMAMDGRSVHSVSKSSNLLLMMKHMSTIWLISSPLLAAQIILYNELRVNLHYVKYELPACKQSICKAIVCALYQLMCKRKMLFRVSSFLFNEGVYPTHVSHSCEITGV